MKCYVFDSNRITKSPPKQETNRTIHKPLQIKDRASPILKKVNADNKKFIISLIPNLIKKDKSFKANSASAGALVRERQKTPIKIKDMNDMMKKINNVSNANKGAIGYLLPKRIRNMYSRKRLFESNKTFTKPPSPEFYHSDKRIFRLWCSPISAHQRNGALQLQPKTLNLYEDQEGYILNKSSTIQKSQEVSPMKLKRRSLVEGSSKASTRRWYDIKPRLAINRYQILYPQTSKHKKQTIAELCNSKLPKPCIFRNATIKKLNESSAYESTSPNKEVSIYRKSVEDILKRHRMRTADTKIRTTNS